LTHPWLAQYPSWVPATLVPSHRTLLEALDAQVRERPGAPAVRYFGRDLTWAELDREARALASALSERGVRPGDRVALLLQNVPQFAIAVLATWRLGGVVLPLNPMLRALEVRYHLEDSGAVALIALDSLYREAGEAGASGTSVQCAIATADLDYGGDEPVPPVVEQGEPAPGAERFLDLVAERGAGAGPAVAAGDLAMLGYTSGTTGRPKGALITQANLVHQGDVYRVWNRITGDDRIFAAAPLFHITGMVGHLALSLLSGATMVLAHRFHGVETLRQIERHRCTFTVCAITAYLAMLEALDQEPHDLSSLRVAQSGGAPVSPATVERFRERTGVEIRNVYGLTETTSPSHATPLDRPTPVDPESGALSVGVPVPGHEQRVVDLETGEEVPVGELGELWTRGPGVVGGYWQRPDASAAAFTDGFLHTGDVGRVDAEGWFYLVDRAKDMINVSGYKVWPREVEDYLYEHPAVREAAVVGAPDPYRGETVVAFVALREGATAGTADLFAFCRQRMAAYKRPRRIEVVNEVPKTATGKFLRRELRRRLVHPPE
jgi:long-chain acyl-CoA synthetase